MDERVIDGAPELIAELHRKSIPARYITNTTTACLETLARNLQQMGLPIEPHEILSPSRAAALYMRSKGYTRCHLVMREDTTLDFQDFESDAISPEAIVVGDIGDQWAFPIINQMFSMMMNGAELIAMHKGKYWEVNGSLQIDIGVYITGLEYATGKEATVIGKPSRTFFETALSSLMLGAKEVLMIGDDIESDIGGAQAMGIQGILVKTGKYRKSLAENSKVTPRGIIENVGEMIHYL